MVMSGPFHGRYVVKILAISLVAVIADLDFVAATNTFAIFGKCVVAVGDKTEHLPQILN